MKQRNLESQRLAIQQVPITQLQPAAYNPRRWEQEAINNLTESIKRFGLLDPIIANSAPNRKNVVIGGHFRIHVAKKLGYKEVPVVYVNIPEIEKEKELNLRLNANTGAWDYELLKSFDLDLLLDVGFDDTDLSHIWDESLETEDDNFNVEQELQKITKPRVQIGDLFQLGRHRLICGDSTDPNVVRKLVGKSKIDMIYTDPPFNISLDYNKGIGGKKRYGGTKTNDNKSEEEYKVFLKQIIENALSVADENCHCFFYCDQKYIGLLQQIYKEVGLNNKRVCLWIKNNSNITPQIAFSKVYEPCVYGVRGTPYLNKSCTKLNEILNKEVDTGNRAIDDMLDMLDIWLVKRLPTNQYSHPTEKSVTLHEKPLRRCTKVGDTVLDLCAGSGSTLISCEQLNRTAFVAEYEPIFTTLIINRYEQLTGKKAKKIN